MSWVYLALLAVAVVATLLSLWWAHRPVRTGLVLLGLCLLAIAGVERQTDFVGVREVSTESGEWCLTYEYPDGSTVTQCRPTEAEVHAWADALNAELGNEERITASGNALVGLFLASLGGAIASFGWAAVQHRRSSRSKNREPAGT